MRNVPDGSEEREDDGDRSGRCDVQDEAEGGEDDLKSKRKSYVSGLVSGWSKGGRTTRRSATMAASSPTEIWTEPSTDARMTAADWPTRACTSPIATVMRAVMSPTMGCRASTVQFSAVMYSTKNTLGQ